MSEVLVSASFDDLRSRDIRLLQEAASLGKVHVLLWSDDTVRMIEGIDPKFPQEERQYLVEAIRYVDRLSITNSITKDGLPLDQLSPGSIYVGEQSRDSPAKESFCQQHGLEYAVIAERQLLAFPESGGYSNGISAAQQKKVLVTGCYDWFHSGHVRFFEEVSELGDVYVVVGHDANIKLLKGEGHPMHSADERRYMAGSIRFVKRALVSTGDGWLDAEPEIEQIKPDIYAVNEDGDVPEKSSYCKAKGIEYHVLKRTPKEGLPRRQSTELRGF